MPDYKRKGLGSKLRQWKRNRLANKGKLVASQYMTQAGEGKYSIDPDNSTTAHGHATVTDPKNKVTGETGTQYKVSRKGKIKKQV